MAKRDWNHLDPSTTYVISAANGWRLTMNPNGTVSMTHGGSSSATATATATTDMSIQPDPGNGEPFPPTK